MGLGLALALNARAACSPEVTEGPPDERFHFRNGGATVWDAETGLEWKRCAEGHAFMDGGTPKAYEDDSCAITDRADLAWEDALQRAEVNNTPVGEITPNGLPEEGNFAGHDDWRVPNIKELVSASNTLCVFPAFDDRVFPTSEGAKCVFWSSTPGIEPRSVILQTDAGNVTRHHLDGGYMEPAFSVRLVRDEPSGP